MKKGAFSSSEDKSAPCVGKKYRVPGCISHLFGNPAILLFRTRGFASPDYSGFARSENVFKLDQTEIPRTALFEQEITRTCNKKRALLSSEDKSAPCVGKKTGCQDAYLISSATRPSFYSGPVALRHQITLVLPVRRTFFSFQKKNYFLYINRPNLKQDFFSLSKIFFREPVVSGNHRCGEQLTNHCDSTATAMHYLVNLSLKKARKPLRQICDKLKAIRLRRSWRKPALRNHLTVMI